MISFTYIILGFSLVLFPSAALSTQPQIVGIREDLHFSIHARATNKNGSLPIYKNSKASIDDRVADLLPRMTVEEKVSQM